MRPTIACKMQRWGPQGTEPGWNAASSASSSATASATSCAIVPFVLLTMVVYYASLDLPKTIINEAIQGGRFPEGASTTGFLGLELGRLEYLFALSMIFLGLIVLNGWLKFRINTMKGWMGERMLRRLRYVLYDHILRFPLARFRRVKAAEMATMIKDEVEPLGGFIGEALITPLFLGGQALTAMFFILYQHWALGLIALAVVGVQALPDPAAAQAPAGARARAPAHRARARRAHRRDRRRRGRDPRQRHLELRARRDLGAPRPHLPHPLRVLPAQVPDQVPEQFPVAGDAVPVLHGGRLPRDHGQPRHRRAGRGDRRLQGPAQPGEGADRLGPAAPRRRGEVRAGDGAVHWTSR